MKSKQIGSLPVVKKNYAAPQIERIQLDQEIAMVMSSESPFPPPEFLIQPSQWENY